MIYLDHNATTPCATEVLQEMLPYFTDKFGNASSRTHPYGWVAAEAVERARRQVAHLIAAEEQEIIFTSGATESCNLAIKGVYERYAVKGNHIITCATEHKAVLDTCAYLERKGAEVSYLPVDKEGLIDLELLEKSIRDTTILVAVMYANNETGVIQPVAEIGKIARKHKVLFFTDATQAVGKTPVHVTDDYVDLLALSGHKIYGPKGVGALYVKRRNPRVSLTARIHGGGQEKGFRSGTLNVTGIVGLGSACALAGKRMQEDMPRLASWRDMLEQAFTTDDEAIINGGKVPRLAHVSNISFRNVKAERLIAKLNGEIAFAVGSACTSAHQRPSHVLEAMNVGEGNIEGAVRFSLGRGNTIEEIETAIARLKEAVLAEQKIDKTADTL